MSAAHNVWAHSLLDGCRCLQLGLTLTRALLPQPTRRAFDLERLHGKSVHGCLQLPPHAGVRHDESGQGLCHRAFEFLRTEEHLHPLDVRMAPPTLNAANTLSPQSTNSPKHVPREKEKSRWPRGRVSEIKTLPTPARGSQAFSEPSGRAAASRQGTFHLLLR